MSREIGRVEKIEEGWMIIKIPTGDNRGICSSPSSCSFQGPDSAYRFLKAPYESWIAIGDRVTLETPESAGNISTLVALVFPLVLISGGILLTSYVPLSPYQMAAGAAAGLALYLTILYLVNRWFARSARFRTRILAVDKSQPEQHSEASTNKEELYQ